jgi:hypothetical protein
VFGLHIPLGGGTIHAELINKYFHRSLATFDKDTETQTGKDSILPPAPQKSFLDGAQNRVARKIAQIRTDHWLWSLYLKRTRKNTDDEISDRCWWCGQWRMVRHPCISTMHAPGFRVREIRDLGTARRRCQNRQAANVNRANAWQSEVGKTPR